MAHAPALLKLMPTLPACFICLQTASTVKRSCPQSSSCSCPFRSRGLVTAFLRQHLSNALLTTHVSSGQYMQCVSSGWHVQCAFACLSGTGSTCSPLPALKPVYFQASFWLALIITVLTRLLSQTSVFGLPLTLTRITGVKIGLSCLH